MTKHETALRNVLRMCQDARLGYKAPPQYCDAVLQLMNIRDYVRDVLKLKGELLL